MYNRASLDQIEKNRLYKMSAFIPIQTSDPHGVHSREEILQRFFLTSFFSVLAYLDIADCGGTTRQGLPLRPLPPILTFNLTEI